MYRFIRSGITMFCLILSGITFAEDKGKTSSPVGDNPEKVTYSTKLDFDSALIDGRMKAPTGFYLQGRNKHSLSNMVRLRANFREKLRDSKVAVKAMIR